ncbi:MAG: tetratricopeptide repeat protein, partial [Planctomycetota bacterium]|nr:tetratricopeptide repeat protein [Planctomycetota bacterium]
IPLSPGNRAVGETGTLNAEGFDDSESGRLFSMKQLLNPLNLAGWAVGLLWSWLLSRDKSRMAWVVLLMVVAGVMGFLPFVWHASDNRIVDAYESAWKSARKAEDSEREEIYLKALSQLRPEDPEVRFRMALFLIEHGNQQEGLASIGQLAPKETDGHAAARLWLVEQARRPNPVQKLTLPEIEEHLKKVLRQDSSAADAHRQLAELYFYQANDSNSLLEQAELLKQAEEHMMVAEAEYPFLNLGVAQLKKMLQRPEDDVNRFAQRAIDKLTPILKLNPADVDTRVAISEARLILGQRDSAREILKTGLDLLDDATLHARLVEFDLQTVEQLLTKSSLTGDKCLEVLKGVLKLDPSNLPAIQRLAQVKSLGVPVLREEGIEQALDYWQEKVKSDETQVEPRLALSQLLVIVGESELAARILDPAAQKDRRLRISQAQLLMSAGRKEEASAILDEIIRNSESSLERNPKYLPAVSQKAECLLIANSPQRAKDFLEDFARQQENARIPSNTTLKSLYGRACLQAYDQRIPLGVGPIESSDVLPSTEPDALLQLLVDVYELDSFAGGALQRLARLAVSDHPASGQAEDMLRQVRERSSAPGKILTLAGTQALFMGNYAKAMSYLNEANVLSNGRDPETLNNLAIARTRGEPRDLQKALELVNQALLKLPDNPDILSTRGEIYVSLQQWEDASRDLQQALLLRPDSKEIHQFLEQVCIALKDENGAETHRQELIRLK